MRRSDEEAGVSLDSLMDTLTNVVGILIIMLVVTQVGVSESIKRIVSSITITQEQLDESEAQVRELEALRKMYDSPSETDPEELLGQNKLTLEEHKEHIRRLKESLASLAKYKIVNIDAMRKETAKNKAEKEKLTVKVNAISKEIAELKAKLAKLPEKQEQPPPVKITLPNPRPAPKDTKPFEFAIRHGRLRPLDLGKLRKIAEYEVARVAPQYNTPKGVDGTKITAYFESKDIGDPFFRLKFRDNSRGQGYAILEERDKRGNNIEGLVSKDSLYRNMLTQLSPNQYYLRYRVWNDSFETYLVARDIASNSGRFRFAAGWEPYTQSDNLTTPVSLPAGLKLIGTPPPRRPNPNPQPRPNRPKVRPPLPLPQID